MQTAERIHYSSVSSTMDAARELWKSGHKSAPFVVTADIQTSGRGRLGSNWVSLSGNLLATLVVDPQVPQTQRARTSFVTALAVFDALTQLSTKDFPIKLKWPNDILLDGSKISGLLLEALPKGPLLVGIGINLKQNPSGEELDQSRYTASNLSEFVLQPPEIVLDAVLESFDYWMQILRNHDFERIRKTWLSRAYGIGQKVTVRLPKESFDGTFDGIDSDGSLVLQLPDGQRKTILAGAVFF